MAIASISETFDSVSKVIRRFPVSILAAYVATILLLVANHYSAYQDFVGGYIATAVFGFSFALAIDLFLETRKVANLVKIIVRILVVALVIAGYFSVFRFFNDWGVADVMRFVLLNLASLSLMLFAPFLSAGKMNAFWQFVISLFIRIVQAFFFFGILYLGLAALMASIDYLFEVNINELYYFDVWLCVTGFLVTTFVLSGIASNFKTLDRVTAYPKFLRILTEYFLVPLVFLYLVVLYVYFGKILVTFDWPNGGVAWWIIGFSFVGVITYFLAHSSKEKFLKHVEFFKQWFFVGLIPLLAVLFMAIYLRISEYGITEPRYFVLMYGVWLFLLCVYYIFSKSKSLKFIPILLFGFLLFSSYGPQSAFDVARWSQLNRLEKVLVENGMLEDGKVVKADLNVVDQKEVQNIGSMVSYFVDYHGTEVFQPWFNENLGAGADIFELMGIRSAYYDGLIGYDGGYSEDLYVSFGNQGCGQTFCTVDVSGFDEYFPFYAYSYSGDKQVFSLDEQNYEMTLIGPKSEILVLREPDCEDCKPVLQLNLLEVLESLVGEFGQGSQDVPEEKLNFIFGAVEVRIENITAVFKRDPKGELDKEEEFVKVDSVGGAFLFKKQGLIPPAL